MKKVTLLSLLLSAGVAFGQVSYAPVTVAFPQIAIGGDADGQNYVTLLQVVNNNSATTTGRVALFSDNGAALAVLFDGQGPQSTIDLTLGSGESRQVKLTLNGPVSAGWMEITYSPSDALTTVILQFRAGPTLLSEVGVGPAFNTIAGTDLAADTDTTLNTGIAIANPSTATAYFLARLWDPGTGAVVANTAISLPPNGHIARFLTEMFPNVVDITRIRAKLSIDSCSSASCDFAGGNGLIATAVRLNGDQFTTLPIAERPPDGDEIRILPQVAFGGPGSGLNMKTVLYFTTNVSTGVFGKAELFDNDGNPLEVSAEDATRSSSFMFTVLGNRVSRVVLSGDSTLRSGWIRLTLSGSVHLVANAVFQTFNGSNLVSEASVQESAPVTRGLIYVKAQSGLSNVGVAFANSQPAPNAITLELFNREGFVSAARVMTLPANGHLAQFVTEIFPQLASEGDFDGALSMRGAASFSALALRLSSDKIATLPVAADGMYRPSITSLRVTSTQRSPARVNFEIDVADFDSDIATSSSTTVSGVAYIDLGTAGYDYGPVSMDGTALLNRSTGTLSGSFQPPRVTGAVPSGYSAVLILILNDASGNTSNIVALPIRF